jgi:hypothetical protein
MQHILKNIQKSKSCKGRVFESGDPISDRGSSLFVIGKIIILEKVLREKELQ